ncbi:MULTISPECIES: hypothetical protein [Pseudomonadota]|uniref:Type I restriction enzyme S subunit n=1 Tax=Paracoccus pantotrophus TaxID=82367 RepID=A0ABX9S443_PARPN|nr:MULTISPECIES: hypothetical protein [Pseudomonadota]RKS42597.1 type I restriction enzyme S subunit [Paracoccus pantotrophus]
MSHYKPYSAYKDSGVEWIGKVPMHWSVVRIKRTAQIATDRCNAIPDGLPYIGLEDVESGSGQYKPTATTSRQTEDSTVGLFCAGDVLYGKLRPYLRKCITGPTDGACSTEFLVLKPSSVLPAWLQNWMLTTEVTQQIEAGCDGAKMPRADWEHVGSIHIPIPDSTEQESILASLDRETGRIDALIAKKTRFIELLKEKITALASPPPDSPNLRWVRLSHVCDVISRPVLQQAGSSYTKLGLFNRGRGIFKRDDTDTEDMGDSDFFWIQSGDLILSGQFAWEGAVALANEEHVGCVVSHRFPVIRGREKEVLTEYLYAYFLTAHGDFVLNDCSRGSAGRNRPLNMNLLLGWKIPILPMQNQLEIARLVQLERVIGAKVNRSVALLKERRSAFITAAVTGQIDLRGEA